MAFFLNTAMTAHQLVTAIRLKAAFVSCEFYVRSGVWCQHLLLTSLFTPWQIVFIRCIAQNLSGEETPWQRGMYASVLCAQSSDLRENNFTSTVFSSPSKLLLEFTFLPFCSLAELYTFALVKKNASYVAHRTHLFCTATFCEDPPHLVVPASVGCAVKAKNKGDNCKSIKNKHLCTNITRSREPNTLSAI